MEFFYNKIDICKTFPSQQNRILHLHPALPSSHTDKNQLLAIFHATNCSLSSMTTTLNDHYVALMK